MAHDDPFTIDLFGNTALSSGFDLGVPGFAADFGTVVDIDPRPSTPAQAAPVRSEPKAKPQMRAKVDFRLQGSRGLAKSWRDHATILPQSYWPTRSSIRDYRRDLTSRPG
ncbi:hypothetical protein [Agrobacterium vitis]|uniref:hypothetical protein n=1 Tax=Agrobacterium vitis TaxID=373 RepID=UPI003B517A5F